jgi:RNA polymerase sigma-70 factor, ECF subfamily
MEGPNMADGGAPLDVGGLVVEHSAPLYRYAFRLTGSPADAEDLTQQVFLIAQQKLAQLRDTRCVQSWLFTVLRNCYLKNHRQRLPMAAAGEIDVDAFPAEVDDDPIDSEQLQTAINELGDEFKTVVLMFYFEHRSYREIAVSLDVPPGTVMSRLARAKAHLRRRLGRSAEVRTVQGAASERAFGPKTFAKSAVFKP